jgi:phage tail-like protein
MSFGPDPFQVFNFGVTFREVTLARDGGGTEGGTDIELCSGAFSEVTGLEATMEPKVIKEGGRNFGPIQRVGPVTFATVILKRGITEERDLWRWFRVLGGGHYAKRMSAIITVRQPDGERVLRSWKLHRAMPIKFKMPDLNATGTSIGIEEIHLAHEGLELLAPDAAGAPASRGGGQ